MPNYTVVWDGRRDGPNGAYLFAQEQDAQPVSDERSIEHSAYRLAKERRERIWHRLRDQPATYRELAEELELTRTHVCDAVNTLIRTGRVRKVGERPSGEVGRGLGRIQSIFAAVER